MTSRLPKLAINGSTLSPTSDTGSPMDPTTRRVAVLRNLRAPPLKYAWSFYHEKAATSSTKSYEDRLTLLKSDIITIKPFWEVLNSFPFGALSVKDSVHFFKRGVKPVWEDSRNVDGGAWTFRIPKGRAEEFFKQILFMGVGEQFADVIQPGDDLCGMSMSARFNSCLVSVWNRRGSNEKSKDGILRIVQENISPDMKDLLVPTSIYYKRHSEHLGFNEVVQRPNKSDHDKEDGKIHEAEVDAAEGNEALLKEAESVDITGLR